jgi:transpeptidase family protein/MecA-like transpeptidase family protein
VRNLPAERRRRLTHRALPALGGIALTSLALGALVGSFAESAAERTARAFADAWEQADYAAMHGMLTGSARERFDRERFRSAYDSMAATTTARSVDVGDELEERGDSVVMPVTIDTRVFGPVRGEVVVPVSEEQVDWAPHLVFPGLTPGVELSRRSDPPRRARLLSRDGRVLAKGPADARGSPLEIAGSIAGSLAPEETEGARAALYARGFPVDWPVGQTGLEHAFEEQLAGRPGGTLLAGARVLARARPRASRPVRTTIDTRIQEAAVTALAGRFGGIAALDPRNAEVLAVAGIAFSAPQPPGSVFKIVTTTAALEDRLVKPSTDFPVESAATIDGVELENANGELCGGSFQSSFAHSCNSVFAPLGVRVGSARLVEAAERYGFNGKPSVPGEVPSSIPSAGEITSPLEVGSTAIGQGRVLATPLVMASVAQTIAAEGVRTTPTLAPGQATRGVRVTSRRVARTIERMMVDVVGAGTGTAAAIPGVAVAGKTGTAELEDTRGPNAEEDPAADAASNTNAWFTSYAPAGRPRIAVSVMLVRAGAGGAVAAPAARLVLEAGLRAG